MTSFTRQLPHASKSYDLVFPQRGRAQRGQALIEGLVVLLLLLSFWVGIAWLGRIQDMALQAQHASRYSAFSATRNPVGHPIEEIRDHFFSGPAHQWSDRKGDAVLRTGQPEVTLHLDQAARLDVHSQPGANGTAVARLRDEWHIEDGGVLRSVVRVAPRTNENTDPASAAAVAGLAYFDRAYPTMSRQVSILVDAAHASDDAATQWRVSESKTAWGDTAAQSHALGSRVDAAMGAIDAGWGRGRPQWDWLSPWAGYVPARHIGPLGDPHER